MFKNESIRSFNTRTSNTRTSASKRNVNRLFFYLLMCTTTFFVNSAYSSEEVPSNILVLDFELNDLTLYPDPKEEIRVKTLRPFLEESLRDALGHNIAALDQDLRDAEDKGKGYIFDRPEVSAKMGRDANAEWVVTGKLHKASFLFVYLIAQLVNTETDKIDSDFVVEIKGWEPRLTKKGVEALALKIDESLKQLNGK